MRVSKGVIERLEKQSKTPTQDARKPQKKDLAKLIRVSDKTYAKLQKVQHPRESYGEVADRAADALLEKERVSPEG